MASATPDEYEYILRETNWVLPEARLTNADIRYSYTGVRPLPYAEGDVADITRRHELRSHDPEIPGLFTLVGGKLTTFRKGGRGGRQPALQAVRPEAGLGHPQAAAAGRRRADLGRLRAELLTSGLPRPLIDRLVDQYGTRALDLARFIAGGDGNAEIIDEGFGLTVGEVRWAVEVEDAQRLADILCRRTMVGLENHLGRPVADRVAGIAAESLGWDAACTEDELARYEHYLTRFTPLA
ncbi:MAG: glycerol-3-phosphate dehydrogenase C-terminal domain-containing protein [Micropruina sp.]